MPYYQFLGKKIFYKFKNNNSNRLLVFIHGSGGTSDVWDEQLTISDEIDVAAVDLPSHGKSDTFQNLNLNLYVDAIHSLIEELRHHEVILAGHSLGGAIIQEFYFKYPDKVNKLILIGTGGRLRVLPAIFENLKNNFQEFLNSLPAGAFYHKTSSSIIKGYLEKISDVDPNVIYQDFKICDNFDRLQDVESIKIPCLIVCGKADKLTPVKYSTYFDEKIERSKLVVIEKAGHMVMLEKPGELNRVITEFIHK